VGVDQLCCKGKLLLRVGWGFNSPRIVCVFVYACGSICIFLVLMHAFCNFFMLLKTSHRFFK